MKYMKMSVAFDVSSIFNSGTYIGCLKKVYE